jgi:hypothetical protein
LEDFKRVSIWIANVYRTPAGVHPGIDRDGVGHPGSASRLESREQQVEFASDNADVSEAHISWAAAVTSGRGPVELEQLYAMTSARQFDLRHPHLRLGLAHDRGKIAALALLAEDQPATERVAPELQGPIQVRDGEAGVM